MANAKFHPDLKGRGRIALVGSHEKTRRSTPRDMSRVVLADGPTEAIGYNPTCWTGAIIERRRARDEA